MRSTTVHTSANGPSRTSQLDPKAEQVGSFSCALPWTDWLQVLGMAAFVIALLLMRIEPGLASIDEAQNKLFPAPTTLDEQSATADPVR
jgi:hypothetical protein